MMAGMAFTSEQMATAALDAFEAYNVNASYREDNDAAKAAAFITACTRLIGLLPTMSRQSARFELGFTPSELRMAKQDAERFLQSTNAYANGAARYFSLENFRQ